MGDVIKFPGVRSTSVGAPDGDRPARVDDQKAVPPVQAPPMQLTASQQKAIQIIASGMTFICIGLRPTGGGADLLTACQGDHDELRNFEQEIPAAISRLYTREGIR